MEALPMNPEIEPEKSESDSESTGSHDSALNEDENIAEPLQIDSFGPECVDLGVPEAEANIPQTEPICNQSENEAVNTEHAEGSSIPMFKSSISLDIQQSELPSEQNVHKLPEAETDLTKKFEQVLILPDNSNSPQLSPDKAVNEVVTETQLNENVADQNLTVSVEQDENAENASCKTVKRKLSKVADSSNELEEVDSQNPQEDDNCNLSPQKQFKVSCESVTSDVNLNNNNDESPAEDAETNKNPDETNSENLPGKDTEKLNQNDGAKRIESFDELANSTELEDLPTGEETGNISCHRQKSIENLDWGANSSDASPLREKSHHKIETGKGPEQKVEDCVQQKGENVTADEQQRDQSEQTEESDESDDDDKFILLKKVKDPKVVTKKNSRKFKFAVGVDIFELGLDEDSLFCGVLLTIDDSKCAFYPGTTLPTEEGVLIVCSYVPNVLFEKTTKFSYTYAVSQSENKADLQQNPNLLVASDMEPRVIAENGQKLIDDSNFVQIFKPCESPQKACKSVSENERLWEKKSQMDNNVSNNVPVVEDEPFSDQPGVGTGIGVTGNKTLLETSQISGSDAADRPKNTSEAENAGPCAIKRKTTSVDLPKEDQSFSRIANGIGTSQSKARWSFSFCVGKDIFDLEFCKDAEIYCGVAIITENKNKQKNFAFFPANKDGVVDKDGVQYQRLTVNLLDSDILAGKYFSYSYAVSLAADKNVHAKNSSFISFSNFKNKVTVSNIQNYRLIDDSDEVLDFKPPRVEKTRDLSPMKTRAKAKEEVKTAEVGNESPMRDDEADDFLRFENSDDFANVQPLKQICENPSIEKWIEKDEKMDSYVILNAIFGPDLSMLFKNKPFLIGVTSSSTDFNKVTPGYICSEVDGYLWVRFHVTKRTSKLYFEYKYVAVTHLREDRDRWVWEKLHRDGTINRMYSEKDMVNGKREKFDGLITFHKSDQKSEQMFKKFFKNIKNMYSSVVGNENTSHNFYLQQNSKGLYFYLHHQIESFIKAESYQHHIPQIMEVINSLSWARYGHDFETRLLSFTSHRKVFEAIMDTILGMCQDSQMSAGSVNENFECQLIMLVWFIVIKALKIEASNFSGPDLEQFLAMAAFKTRSLKHDFLKLLNEKGMTSSMLLQVSEVCKDLMSAAKKSSWFAVLLEWMSFTFPTEEIVSFPAWFALNEMTMPNPDVLYVSSFTRRQLLNSYVKSNQPNPDLALRLNCSFQDITWVIKQMNSTQFRCINLHQLPLILIKHCLSVEAANIRDVSDLAFFLCSFRDILNIGYKVEYLTTDEDKSWFNSILLQLLQFLDIVHSNKVPLPGDEDFNLGFLVYEVALKVNRIRLASRFTTGDAKRWAFMLQPRDAFSSDFGKKIEVALRKCFIEILSSIRSNDLFEVYGSLPSRISNIKSSHPEIDLSGLESVFDEAVINAFQQSTSYISKYTLDSWSPRVQHAFIKIFCEKFPALSIDECNYTTALKVVNWKPLIPLMELSRKTSLHVGIFEDRMKLVDTIFRTIFAEMQIANVSYDNLAKVASNQKIFVDIFLRLNIVNDVGFNAVMKDLNALGACVQSHVQDISRLGELVRKFTSHSSVIRIETSSLDGGIQDWQKKPLNELAAFQGTEPVFGHNKLSPPEMETVKKFSHFMSSRIFANMAVDVVQTLLQRTESISYSEFLNLLPEIEANFLRTADQLASGQLTAKDAQDIFKQFNGNHKTKEQKSEELNFLIETLASKMPNESKKSEIKDLFNERNEQVLMLDSLDLNLQFLSALDGLKNAVGIETNFTELDVLKRTSDLSRVQLCELSQDVLKCNQEFAEVTADQIKAIKCFVDQPAFLAWIKKKMRTLQDVKVVTELASLSAGEVSYEIDKVKCFHDAIFGYAPLIYDLKPNSTFEHVKTAYNKVFAKLGTDCKLSSKYEDSARQFSWFEKALETQGSVEKSSLEKALQINNTGVYIVRYSPQSERKVLIEPEDAVMLHYKEEMKSADGQETEEKRELNLAELRDLLSRLMLIVGKEKHEHAQSVDIFITTFQNIERLSSSFVTLYNSGCGFFNAWSVHIRTRSDGKTHSALEIKLGDTGKNLYSNTRETNLELSDLCIALESIKEKWEQYVFAMRCRLPILNEFNMQQLSALCLGLAKLKRNTAQIDGATKYYLESIDQNISKEDIVQFLYDDYDDNSMETEDSDSLDIENQPIALDELTGKAHVDERSAWLNLIDSLKSQFNDNENLAKAGIQAIRDMTDGSCENCDEADALNWIMDHEDQEEIVENLSRKFEDHFASLDRTETTGTGLDKSGNKIDLSNFAQSMEHVFDKYLSEMKENSLENYVNLFQLGFVLNRCLEKKLEHENTPVDLKYPEHLKLGKPNLVICEKRSDILLYIMSLYNFVSKEKLPDYNQVLLCNATTSVAEVETFMLRAMLDPRNKVYSIAFADDLSPTCADQMEKLLFEKIKDPRPSYKLIVFNCDDSSQVSVALEKFKARFVKESEDDLRSYLCGNLRAAEDAIDTFRVRLISSTQPSSGKSLHVDRLESETKKKHRGSSRVILRLYDRNVDFERVLDFLWRHKSVSVHTIIHLDVSPNVMENVDELLFKLCVLGGLADERGKLFLAKENFCLAIEMLTPQNTSPWKPLCSLMPCTVCLSPNQCLQDNETETNFKRIIGPDPILIQSPEFQRSYHYLDAFNQNRDLSFYTYQGEMQDGRLVIDVIKRNSGLNNPTWAQLSFFARFLNLQLIACEQNFFVGSGEFEGFKNFYVKHCLIAMAQDFALPSLSIADNSPLFGLNESETNYEVHQIRRRWENCPHPYVFINSDQMTFTFLGVRITNSNLQDWGGKVLARNVMSADLQQKIKRQAFDERDVLDENFDDLQVNVKQMKLCRVLGVEPNRIRFDPTYELTQDNVMKLLAIYMRFRCNIPVVIMGETGCGKTRLIEYLCNIMARGENVENKKFVKVHGGVTMQDIVQSIEDAEKLAMANTEKFGNGFYTVLFFDEANTTEAIYGIKEVICDFSVNGRKLDPDSGLKVIVACNPYRKHDDKMIKKLESQGLGYHVKSSETKDKLDSDIPMRHLVYRVNPLPPSLLPLVWDFGQLTSEVENKYIKQLVSKRAADMRLIEADVDFICNLLSRSQKFLRENRDQCLFVSLRDIERAMAVLQFFYSKKETLLAKMDELDSNYNGDDDGDENAPDAINEIARLMILTLGVCYHSSLEEREKYRRNITGSFRGPYKLPNGAKTILNELEICMQVFLQNIHLDAKANIAKNLALTENVFMMIICIELRIPLFLVGKPGSSKSLAKTIVIDAMQGESSRNEFFQMLKQVQMLSFQCSPHTHADGIISIFKQAALYQKGKNLKQFVSVVVLDEIGLAEDSAKMPLKTLHPLLEEGYVESKAEKQDWGKVGFVGISNWALDPAKMNRGILVSRTIPKSEELVKSARGICRVEAEGKLLEKFIQPLADAYEEVYKAQIKDGHAEYFGLRDFYGLLKMLYRAQMTQPLRTLRWTNVRCAIRRNFGEKNCRYLQVFADELMKKRAFEDTNVGDVVETLDLVHQNIREAEERSKLTEEERNLDNESRYLLLMTENFSALQLLPQVLKIEDYEVIFGSSFPQDQEYIQVCKNINRIKVCMETGKTVVLLNLGSLYESLYDALNQYYVYYGGKRYVDLGLGSNRVKCSVSENFRLIMIEEEKIAITFPIPLLNRLEKHFLGMESILSTKLVELRQKLSENLEEFSDVPRTDKEGSSFHVRDAFVGYQKDTTACVLIQAENDISDQATNEQILEAASLKLVQTCSIDAIIRSSSDVSSFNSHDLKEIYSSQGRNSLSDFLWQQCYNKKSKSALIEVSTFCRIPSSKNMKDCNLTLMQKEQTLVSAERHFVINLNVFKTEIEFAERVKDFYRMAAKHPNLTKILFVTCSRGQKFVPLIASAKYKLQNLHTDCKIPNLYTLFIVELPRNWYESDYSSFSVGKWESFHIDELLRDEEYQVLSEVAISQGQTLKDLFVLENGECTKFQKKLLCEVVYDAIGDANEGDKVQRVINVSRLFEQHHVPSLEIIFLEKASAFIEESEENEQIKEWVAQKAANLQDLIVAGTIENALFKELQAKIKPHLADFLKLIDFNNNIKLLFEANWRKEAWMKLFTVKELCRLRPQNPKEVKFNSRFPFSSEIIDKLNSMWIDSLENYADSELEDWQFFVERFNNQGRELGNELTEISSEEDAVDSFVHDLILNEFWSMWNNKCVQAEHVKVIKKALKSIMKSNLPEFENPTVAFAFAHFKKLLPCLHNISPILKYFGSFKIGNPETPEQFVSMITQAALEQTKSMAEKLKPANIDRHAIQELDQQVSVLKMCSGIELDDDKFKLKKLTMLSTYMSQISHNLDDATAKMACTASDTLYKAVSSKTADESIFGTDNFRSRLLFCLNRSADTVIQQCVETETGLKDCAFCRKPVTAKGAIPFSLLCAGGHAVHESCLTEKMENITQGETVTCSFCQQSLDSELLQASTMFSCQTEPQKLHWKQFWLNISNVFLGIVKENVIAICEEETLKKYLEICVAPKSRTSKKDTAWITDQTRQGLLTFIATSEKGENLDEILMAIINEDKETGANEIDLGRTYDMLLSVFEYVYLNESLQVTDDLNREEISSVNQVRLVAKVKIALSEFIVKSVVPNAYKGPQGFTDQVPRLVTEILNDTREIAECVKRYFIQCLCRDHGMDVYQRVKTFPQLAPLIPQILLTSQSQGFSDIFLIFREAYQTPFSEVYTSLVTDANEGLQRLIQVRDLQMKNIVAYRLLAEIRSKENRPESFAQFEEAIMTSTVIQGLSRSMIDRNDRLAPNMDALRHFLFYYQTFLEVEENCGFLQPFKGIFIARGRADGLYLPTFPDSGTRRARMMGQAIGQGFTTWNQCANGHLYMIGDCGAPNQGGTCPECRAPIGGRAHNAFNAGNQLLGNRDANINVANGQVVTGYVHNHNLNVFDRAFLNEFNGNVMQFFVHATLYICNGDQEMLARLRTNVRNLARTSLNRSEEDALKFFLTVVIDSSTSRNIQGSFANEDQRETWEANFINIINNTLQKLPNVIATYDDAFKNDSRNESNNLLEVLTERTDRGTDDNVMASRTFWRRLPKVSLASVRNELNANGEKYKLLDCIFKNKEWLPKLRHVPDLFEFFNNIVSYYDPDTLHSVLTLDSFLGQRKIPEPVRRKMREVSIVFCKLWNEQIRHMPTTGGIDCLFKEKLKLDSSLKYFLPSRHVSDCCALVTLNILVNKNNEFIEAYRSALHIETPAMELNNGVVKSEHVVSVSNVDRELLSVIANFATTDAQAERVHYDLSGIEGTIGHHLFKFKPLISMKIMKLMTKSSSTKDALNNARNCIDFEEKLSKSEAKKIQKKFTDMPEVCKMLRQLILLMKYMEKDRKDDPKQPIGEFLQKISIDAMPGISDIKLESCVFLWQALALQRTRLMLEHQDEEPYAGIQQQFRETLNSEQKQALDKLPAPKKYVLLTYLNELIVLNLDEPDLMNPNFHIVDDGLAPAYFDDDLDNLNLPEWCQLKYAEDIIKHLIQTEG